MNNLDYNKAIERARQFRLAIVMNDHDIIHDFGTLSFYDDVMQTRLADLTEPEIQPTKCLLLGMVDALANFNRAFQENVKSLGLATYNKLESLAWKTYTQLIRRAYRPGSALRLKHLKEKQS